MIRSILKFILPAETLLFFSLFAGRRWGARGSPPGPESCFICYRQCIWTLPATQAPSLRPLDASGIKPIWQVFDPPGGFCPPLLWRGRRRRRRENFEVFGWILLIFL